MPSATTTAEQIDVLTRELAARLPDITAIYLFGSRARGDASSDSDFDVAILPRRQLDAVGRWELQERLASLLGTDVDLVDLLSASTVMRVQVLANGELLYDADRTARESFEATAFGAYARFNEERRDILADIAATGRVHGWRRSRHASRPA
jgi:predicted nucleotidyltransferase